MRHVRARGDEMFSHLHDSREAENALDGPSGQMPVTQSYGPLSRPWRQRDSRACTLSFRGLLSLVERHPCPPVADPLSFPMGT
jgi:hypothetical protein